MLPAPFPTSWVPESSKSCLPCQGSRVHLEGKSGEGQPLHWHSVTVLQQGEQSRAVTVTSLSCDMVHDSMGPSLLLLKSADILGLVCVDDRKTTDSCKSNATGTNWIFGLKVQILQRKSISLGLPVQVRKASQLNLLAYRHDACGYFHSRPIPTQSYICIFCIWSESSHHLVSWGFILRVCLRQDRKEIATK